MDTSMGVWQTHTPLFWRTIVQCMSEWLRLLIHTHRLTHRLWYGGSLCLWVCTWVSESQRETEHMQGGQTAWVSVHLIHTHTQAVNSARFRWQLFTECVFECQFQGSSTISLCNVGQLNFLFLSPSMCPKPFLALLPILFSLPRSPASLYPSPKSLCWSSSSVINGCCF